jgi:uncharacterized protein
MTDLYIKLTQLMDEYAQDDALEAASVHGALSFLAVAGQTRCSEIFAQRAWGEDFAHIPQSVVSDWCAYADALLSELVSLLNEGLAPMLPFEPTLEWEDSEQQAWCVGFMLSLFDWAEHLPSQDDEIWAEAMLPIEVGSGLFVDRPEFASLYDDAELLSSLLEQIPEVLVDLFLLFNASAEDV